MLLFEVEVDNQEALRIVAMAAFKIAVGRLSMPGLASLMDTANKLVAQERAAQAGQAGGKL